MRSCIFVGYSPDLNPIEQAFSKVKGAGTQGRSPHPGVAHRGDVPGIGRGHGPGRPWVLRALRLPHGGPTAMTAALDVWYEIPTDRAEAGILRHLIQKKCSAFRIFCPSNATYFMR
jgi:hypothetical protein